MATNDLSTPAPTVTSAINDLADRELSEIADIARIAASVCKGRVRRLFADIQCRAQTLANEIDVIVERETTAATSVDPAVAAG